MVARTPAGTISRPTGGRFPRISPFGWAVIALVLLAILGGVAALLMMASSRGESAASANTPVETTSNPQVMADEPAKPALTAQGNQALQGKNPKAPSEQQEILEKPPFPTTNRITRTDNKRSAIYTHPGPNPTAEQILISASPNFVVHALHAAIPELMRSETTPFLNTLIPGEKTRNEFLAPFLRAKREGTFNENLPYTIDILHALGQDKVNDPFGVEVIARVFQNNNEVTLTTLYFRWDDQEGMWQILPLEANPRAEKFERIIQMYRTRGR